MGKALYRKYRSKNLDEVVGQDHITNTLKNAVSTGNISHAYLFTGPRGVGKTSVARILAHEINNIPYEDESVHLDIIEIDAASNRRIDEIRELRDKVHIAPTSSKYKVYIIDEVHMLTREAFNALLKTLEEPPEHVVFILATTEAHKVPDTIISRTQQYSFKPIEQSAALDHLKSIAMKENINITDSALNLLVTHANGSFRDSISMLDQISGLSSDEELDETLVAQLLGVPNIELLEDLIMSLQESNTNLLFDTTMKLKIQGASASNTAKSIIELLRHKIAEDKNIDKNRAVGVMKALLPFTASQSSFEAIEVAFLDEFELTKITSTETIKEHVKIEPEANTEPATEETITQEDISESTVIINNSNTNDWNTVLNELKNTHNTLYGVLRMAKADISNDVITLTFAFEFHKKQLNQNKNLDVLNTIIENKLGKKHNLELIVAKKPKKQEKTTLKKPTDKLDENLKSVSNIFGGAELLES